MSIMTGAPMQAQTAPTPPPMEEFGTGNDGRKRVLLLAGGGLALIVVAALAYFFLLSGSSGDGATAPLGAPRVAQSPASPKASTPAIAPLKSFAGKTARNPFKALVSANTGTTGTSGTTGTTGTTGTSAATGTTAASGTTSGSTSGSTGTTTPTQSSVPLTVKVSTIKADKSGATFSITPKGGKAKSYSPALGATFDTYFQLTGFGTAAGATTPSCVLLQYGDASSMLCLGESLTVQ